MKSLRIAAVVCIFVAFVAAVTHRMNPGVEDIFDAESRLKISRPASPVAGLAQPVQVGVEIQGGDIALILVIQRNRFGSLGNESNGVLVGSGEAKIIQDNGIEKTIEIVPLQLGTVNCEIQVFFADGGVAKKIFTLHVVPSSRGVTKFNLNTGYRRMFLILEDEEEDRRKLLDPEVKYSFLDDPIRLMNLTEMKFSVEQSEFEPVVRVDANGWVHALRPGKAVLVGDFDGVIDKIPITVYTKEDVPQDYRMPWNRNR